MRRTLTTLVVVAVLAGLLAAPATGAGIPAWPAQSEPLVQILDDEVSLRITKTQVRLRVPYRLRTAARATLTVRLRGRTVGRVTRNGRRGRNVITWTKRISDPKYWSGQYRFRVDARARSGTQTATGTAG